jgi:hypothetical protein
MHGQKQDSKKYSVSTLFSYHDRQSYVIRSGKDLNRLNNIEKVTLVLYIDRLSLNYIVTCITREICLEL